MEVMTASSRTATIAAPTVPSERISILDSLRGFAILGILLMNIGSFALPYTGHDPSLFGETGVNYYLWYLSEGVAGGTQRALFSLLFGAGIYLFVSGAEKKTTGLAPADLFFRRQLWLILFSLIDVFVLLWHGDILLDYAIYGMMLFTFRKLPVKTILMAAGVCLLFVLARENRDLYKDKAVITRGETVAALNLPESKLTAKQKDELSGMKEFKERASIEKRKENREKAIHLVGNSNYEDLYEYRTDRYVNTMVDYLFFYAWDVLLFMLAGMAFFKSGLLTGKAKAKVYWIMMIVGLGAGLTLSYVRLQPLIAANFNYYDYTKSIVVQYSQLDRVLRSIGLFGLIMVLYKSGVINWLFNAFKAVGRMAFTNYLMQSLFGLVIFTSIGFGLYGKVERYEAYLIVAAIWLFQIIASNIWLRYYRFGPLEWAWRSLTYWKRQPMKKDQISSIYVTSQNTTVDA